MIHNAAYKVSLCTAIVSWVVQAIQPIVASPSFIAQLPAVITSLATLVVAITGLRALNKKTDAIHTLVNSDHGVSLRLSAGYAQRIADLTKDPADVAAGLDTRKAPAEHDVYQKRVNDGIATPLANR